MSATVHVPPASSDGGHEWERARGRRAPRVVLPGGGRWPWWGWALYLLLIGPFLLVALVPAAMLRVVLPERHRVWGFRHRAPALRYLAAVLLLGVGVVAAADIVAGPAGWLPFAALSQLLAPGARPAAQASPAAGSDQPTVSPSPAAASPGGAVEAPGAAPPATAGGSEASPPGAATRAPEPSAPAGGAIAPPAAPQAPAPQVRATATPAPAPRRVAVGNTGGDGVALRRSPRWADRWPGVAWPDRTALIVLEDGLTGDDGAGGTTSWLHVRDPASHDGYVPARFTTPLP